MIRIGTRATGDRAETLAAEYLRRRKLILLTRNYLCKSGEIDLIMRDGDTLVFVEVRHRRSSSFGGALESIDGRKQAKLRRTAEHYLQAGKSPDCPCRFDILCVNGNLNNPEFEWITNAF